MHLCFTITKIPINTSSMLLGKLVYDGNIYYDAFNDETMSMCTYSLSNVFYIIHGLYGRHCSLLCH